MCERPVRPVEDYTTAFLVVAGVFLFFVLVVIWGLFGYSRALMVAGALWLALRVTRP